MARISRILMNDEGGKWGQENGGKWGQVDNACLLLSSL